MTAITIDPLGNIEHRIPINVLRLQAQQFGDREFLIDERGSLTYAEVDALADSHAGAYAELGVSEGDTVALLMENSTTLAVTAFGINRIGGIWSPLSTEYRGEWLRELLRSVRSRILVVDRHLVDEVAALDEIPVEHIVVNGGIDGVDIPGVTLHDLATFAEHRPPAQFPTLYHGDTCAVLWTSGTTGPSKGVMQPHAAWMLWPQRHNEVFRGGVRDGERFYYCMPMYNSGGWLMNIFPALITANAACIDKRFSVTNFWDRIRHYGANHTMTLGTMHIYLFQQPNRPDDADNPLRTLVMNPMVPQILDAFMERFSVELVAGGFGQSEIMGATLATSAMTLKPGSCGVPLSDDLVECKLLDENDEEVGVGEPGEFCVRPKVPFSVFSGYFNQPEETAQAFRNFWHHSGDLGRRDEDGEVFFVDRKKDSLRHKGRNTATFEVEHIARQFPGVVNVAAVGVKVAELEHEEELMTYLLVEDGAEIDPLEFCKFIDAKAPYFFVPRYVEVLTEFPMTPTNKIQKFKLRERGVGSGTWDRTESAPDWEPTRPAGSPRQPVKAGKA